MRPYMPTLSNLGSLDVEAGPLGEIRMQVVASGTDNTDACERIREIYTPETSRDLGDNRELVHGLPSKMVEPDKYLEVSSEL